MIDLLHGRYFSESVYDIHNSLEVTVRNCTFSDNYIHGTGIIKEPYRGNTGGLTITYNRMDASAKNPIVTVLNNVFINNSVMVSENVDTNQLNEHGVFIGRGGGMAVRVNESNFNISARISGCYYFQNRVIYYGGGCHVFLQGSSAHAVLLEDNIFDSNIAMVGGAGIILVGVGETRQDNYRIFTVQRNFFIRNVANIGAGLYYLNEGTSDIIFIKNSIFSGNSFLVDDKGIGAAIAVETENIETPNEIRNWYFNINWLVFILFSFCYIVCSEAILVKAVSLA